MIKLEFIFWTVLALLIAILITFVSSSIVFFNEGEENIQKQAIKANVAKYKLDEKTGKIVFTWLTNNP